MAEDFLSLIGEQGLKDLDTAKKSTKELAGIVVDTNSKIADMYGKLKNNKSFSEFNKFFTDAKRLLAELQKDMKSYQKASVDMARAEEILAKAEERRANASKQLEQAAKERAKAEEILNKAKERANKLADEEAKKASVTENSINAARQAVSALTKERNNLNLATADGITRQKEINSLINQYNDFIKVNVSKLEQQKINIGNYASATMALNQVLREAPAFANSVQTGLMGISNNIPILIDAVKKLQSEGLKTKDILKILGRSFFDMGSILTLVTTGVMLAINWWSKHNNETKKADEYAKSLNESHKEMAASIGKEVAQLNILYRTATNTNLTYLERGKAVDELQSKFPDYFQNISREAVLNGEAQRSYEMLTESIINNAKIKSQSDRLTKAYTEMADAQDRLDRVHKGELYMEPDMEEMYKNRINARKLEIDQIQKQISAQQELVNGKPEFFIDEAARQQYLRWEAEQKRRAEMGKEKPGKTGRTSTKETFNAGIQLSASVTDEDIKNFAQEIQNNAAYKEAIDNIASQAAEITSLEKTALLRVEQDYANGLINYEEYEQKKTDITDMYVQARLKTEILGTQELLQDTRITGDERLALMAHLQDIELQYAKKANEDKLKDDKEAAAKRLQIEKDLLDKRKQLIQDMGQLGIKVEEELVKNLDKQTQRKLDNLEKEKDGIERKKDAEINAILLSTNTNIDKQKLVAEAEARADTQRQMIEKRESDAKRRQANFDKQLATFKILTQMFMGIGKEVETKGIAGLYTSAAITAYMSGIIGLVGALSVPQYAEGTPEGGHPKDGFAIVGDGGERELVLTKNGAFLSPDTPTPIWLAKGEHVIPMHDMIAASGGVLTPGELAVMSNMAGGNVAKLEKLLEQQIAVSQRIADKPTSSISVTEKGIQKITTNGNIHKIWLNANGL